MKVTFFSVLLAATMLFTTQESDAETFRWVDESGKIRIGVKPPAKPDNAEKNKNGNAEIKKSPPVITRSVTPRTVVEHATPSPSPNIIEPPQTTIPVAKPVPAPAVNKPEIVAPIKKPVSTQPPKPVQKTSVKKQKPVRKKALVKKPVAKKAVVRKKPEKPVSAKKKTTDKKLAGKRNEEMCGVFTAYVHDYEEKVRDCSPNLCDIYKRSLVRYKKKQTSYCQ